MSIELKQAAQQALKELGEARKIVRASSSRQLAKDWDHRATAVLADLRTAIQQAEAKTDEPVQADSSGHLRVIASLGATLRRLSFAAQTTGGTDGPDAELQSAIGQAEQALSLGGIGQAMFATTEPVFTSRFGGVVLSGPREDVEFAVRHLPDVDDKTTTPQPSQAAQAESEPVGARKALERIASWSEHPAMLGVDYGSNGVRDYYRKIARDALTHPAPGVPDDVARDAERYRWLRDSDQWPAAFASSQEPEPIRGTDLDSAIDAAMTAAQAQKGQQ